MSILNHKSLLWKGCCKQENVVDDKDFSDIIKNFDIRTLTNIMSRQPDNVLTPEDFLKNLACTKEDIEFRNTILNVFSNKSDSQEKIEKLLLLLGKLETLHESRFDELHIQIALNRTAKLEVYCAISETLVSLFEGCEEMYNYFKEKYISENIDKLKDDLEKVKKITSKYKSVEIGINYNPAFQVTSAIVTKINDYEITPEYFIDKMLKEGEEFDKTPIAEIKNISKSPYTERLAIELYKDFNELLRVDLYDIVNILARYEGIVTSRLLPYKDELMLYLGGLYFMSFCRNNNISYCIPVIGSYREYNGFVSIHMVIGKMFKDDIKVTQNSLFLNDYEKTAIITGPNSGGKTVLIQSLLIMQLLFQNGLLVPCSNCHMKIYKKIFSHFPHMDSIDMGTGGLGEELSRISQILENINSDSLVIMNEPLVTTSPEEGLEILRLVMEKITSDLYIVTHYLNLIEFFIDRKDTVSLAMGILDNECTYKVSRSNPPIESYAKSVAKRHGIDILSLMDNLTKRKLITSIDIDISKIFS